MRSLRLSRLAWLFPTFASLALAGIARSQCATQWLPGPAIAGTDATTYAVTEWDPDGVGPGTPVIVLGGAFRAAGTVPANRIAALDPATNTWSTFGAGMNGTVRALAVLPNGDLVAGGNFTTAGGVPANRIARWDGTAWSPLGSGTDLEVLALAVLPNGDLAAGGPFTIAGGVAASRIARWNGIGWAALGLGLDNVVVSLAVLPNGNLVAGGRFTNAGGAPANRIASWDGTSWSPLGSGIAATAPAQATVNAVTVLANGDVVAGGSFDTAGGVTMFNVARWDGTSWSPLVPGIAQPVKDVCTVGGTGLIAVGENTTGADDVVWWNGVNWSSIGSKYGSGEVVVQLANGNVIVGGALIHVAGTAGTAVGDVAVAVTNVAVWDGTTWSQLGPQIEDPHTVTSVTSHPNGDVVAGTVGLAESRVLHWDGVAWQQLGGAFNGNLVCVAIAANGDVLAGGFFSAIGSVQAAGVARWNGTAWAPVGIGIGLSGVASLLPLANGDIIAGGSFILAGGNSVERWNGTAWAPLGAGLPGGVLALALAPNGDIIACGGFDLGGSRVARWNGTAWTPVGAIPNTAFAVATLPNGEIIVGGTFLLPGIERIARWNGVAWLPLGTGLTHPVSTTVPIVRGIAVLPNGDIVASGTFGSAGGVACHGVARWNGATWSALATDGLAFPQKIAPMANGDLVVTGVRHLDGVVSSGFARLTTTCPATTNVSGASCAGNTLAATTLPWIGSTFRAQATGLPANAIAIDVFGVSTVSIPLQLLLPQGVAGCSLFVSPDAIGALLPSGGAVSTQLPIPNTVSLAGAIVHEQVLALGLGAGGTITTFTGTNRLTLTVGAF